MQRLKKYPRWFHSLVSGLVLGLAWYKWYGIFALAGFMPLLLLTQKIHESPDAKKNLKVWAYSYLAFFIWNIVATWWVYKASLGGAAMAIVCNALLMSWVYGIWYRVEIRIFGGLRFWLLIPFWLAWEYGHTLWDLTWTWLTLGNAFANTSNMVQWYEITGVSGGSLWVLAVNILLVKIAIHGDRSLRQIMRPVLAAALPVILSFAVLSLRHIEPVKKLNVTVIQPNIDPYDTKFVLEFVQQLAQLDEQLSNSRLNKNTQLVVLPETFIIDDIIENDYRHSPELINVRALMKKYFPKASILTGAGSIHVFEPGEPKTATARQFPNSDRWYDAYNTAVYLDTLGNATFYHKSKLVPGVERMPFPAFFRYFEKFAIDMGGTTGSLATQCERTVFSDKVYDARLAPAICYESVYGDFMGQYIKGGAEFIGIITNDGWWGNTPGHRQHLSYAKLRAIETRKQIVRSANTGISCFIDEFGHIRQPQPYWEFAVINQDVALNDVKTFFVRFGDLLSYASMIIAVGLIVFGLIFRRKRSTAIN